MRREEEIKGSVKVSEAGRKGELVWDSFEASALKFLDLTFCCYNPQGGGFTEDFSRHVWGMWSIRELQIPTLGVSIP